MPSRINSQTSDVPIARVDAQDPEQALPVREYLEQNGVAVVLGRKPALPATYHIICGDGAFMKETLSNTGKHSIKPYIVLFLSHGLSVPDDFFGMSVKIAAVRGNRLPARDVATVFAYFFTGDQSILYVDASREPMVEVKPIEMDRKVENHKRLNPALAGFNLNKSAAFRFYVLVIGFFIAPFLWYLVSVGMMVGLQWYGIAAAKQGNIARLPMLASATSFWVGQGSRALALIGAPAGVLGASSTIRSHERLLSVIRDVAGAEEKLLSIASESKGLAGALFSRSETPMPVRVDRVRLTLDEAADRLGLAEAQLRLITADSSFPFGFTRVRTLVGLAQEEVGNALGWVGDARNLLSLYRVASGFDRKKTYLVLLQNSMELRPTGGFIGSVATVSMEEGITEMPIVQDVYALDGQLKGHVDPPAPIRDLLKQEHWYLRDSNWDPDFAVSGEKAAWFYEKETGQTVDGVIAITTNVLTNLLEVTGPIDLPDYSDRITKENFFGKSLFYTKADFFPGSTQKKDFLGSLVVALMSRLSSGKPGDGPALLRVVGRALAAGDIQFWFLEGQSQAVAQQAGWAGEVVRPIPCQTLSPTCMVDRVALIESNMGVNKVNSFVKRSVKSRVDLTEDGVVDGVISLTYQNTSTDDAALSGGGVYLVYLRAFLPLDALVISAVLDGVEIPEKLAKVAERTTPYRDPDETIGGSNVASVAFTVPPGRERSVMITYRRGIPLPFADNESTFVLSIRKQPGTTDTTLDVGVGYPAAWSTDAATETFANVREVRYNTLLDQTKVFTVRFKK